MNKTVYNDINETLYHEKLANGLNVYLLPKPGFNKTYATLSTPLGSNVTDFTYNGEAYSIPKGVAHFLEHKLFDNDGHDISEDFAINDAQVNAYTMNNQTTYLFSCTNNLSTNITTLLNFVFNPTFTDEGIKKEIGIIAQEIKMYDDDPNTLIYMGALKNMFHSHPVRNDILGTIESIMKIDKDTLTTVHKAFYNPHNMIMFVTGNIDIDKTMATIRENTVTVSEQAIVEINNITVEDTKVSKPSEEIKHEIFIPNCLLGIKQKATNTTKENILKKELTYSVLFDIILGRSTENYQKLLDKNLINDTFGMDSVFDNSYGYVLIGCNTYYPHELYKELKTILMNPDNQKIDIEHFKRTKKQIIGGFINALNSLEYIANQFTKYHFNETSLFNVLDLAKQITLDDIKDALKTLLDEESYSTFTIYPKK